MAVDPFTMNGAESQAMSAPNGAPRKTSPGPSSRPRDLPARGRRHEFDAHHHGRGACGKTTWTGASLSRTPWSPGIPGALLGGAPVLTGRKPRLLLLLSGVLLLRFATRALSASLFQLPPRLTRFESAPVVAQDHDVVHVPDIAADPELRLDEVVEHVQIDVG